MIFLTTMTVTILEELTNPISTDDEGDGNDKQRCRAICKDEEYKSMMQKVHTFYSNDYFYMSMSCCHFVHVSVYCQRPN